MLYPYSHEALSHDMINGKYGNLDHVQSHSGLIFASDLDH
jgi:hypothetical protein